MRALIAANHDVQVIENATANDITRDTMMQVVTLLEDGDRPLFSHAFLTQLIQCHALGTWGELGQYLDECMKSFVARSEAGTDPLARVNDAPTPARTSS